MALSGPRLPVLGKMVAENMRAVGVYSRQTHREYFRQVANQLAGWLHVFRYAGWGASRRGVPMPEGLARIVGERVCVDDSVDLLRQAAGQGKGVVLMAMHIIPVPLWLARLNQECRVTVLGRYSKDERHQRIKERWWHVTDVDYVAVRKQDQQPGSRLAEMSEVLRQGRIMAITPDLARKRTEGKPVRLFDRQVHLPSGAAVLSVVTGAPLVMISAKPMGKRTCLTFRGPFEAAVAADAPDDQAAAIAERMQWFADGLETFLRQHAPLWFFWGDKRWTGVFRGDPRYVGAAEPSEPPTPDDVGEGGL